jgi:hypothetical protein
LLLQELGSAFVVFRGKRMLAAIDLDDEPVLARCEVADVLADWELPVEPGPPPACAR